MCSVQYYDALIDFIGHYLKRARHKYKGWGYKKNNMNLDIRPGSEYQSDEQNKVLSFSKQAILKATIWGIRMYLLLWKNQKGSTRYPMIFYKWDSTADIFLWIFNFFSDKLISQNSSKNHWL